MARWRLASHVRRQDWAAVVIDLAIVVLGVFLGIQVSNWNEERLNRRVAGIYLDRIEQDLRYDLEQFRLHEAYWRVTAESGDRAVRFAEEGKLDRDEWTTLLDFYYAGDIWNYTFTDGTYREMLSAGRLDLFGDTEFKAELSEYYLGQSAQARVLFDVQPRYREDIRAAVPYRFQRYILDRCESDASRGIPSSRCPPPPDLTGLAALNRSLATDSRLMGELRSWMTTLRYTRTLGDRSQQRAARLIRRIEAERS